MKQKIIALDLDGTLLRSDNTLSDYTVKTIQSIQELGHLVVIATGRPYRMAIDYYQQLGLTTPLITFNGSLTNIPNQHWECEHSVTIDKKYLFAILDMKERIQADFIASEYRQRFYLTMDYPDSISPKLFGVETITEQMLLDPSKITRNPNAILLQTRHEDKYALAEEMREHFNHALEIDSWGGPLNILECSPKGVNKAYALKHLLTSLNKNQEDLIAFGDEHNDTEMLALAATGYAMKNANPILLPYADKQTTGSNDQDGVAKTLETLFL